MDVDGTLCLDDFSTPESAKSAIRQTRDKGNLVYLCTGRSKAEIVDEIIEIGIDGIIGAGGGYAEINEQVLFHKKMEEEVVRHLVDYFLENDVMFYLESNGGLFTSPGCKEHMEKAIYGDVENDPKAKRKKEEEPHVFFSLFTDGITDFYRDDINKVCFFGNDQVSIAEIEEEFKNELEVIRGTMPIFGKHCGELAVRDVHKGTAIKEVLNHLNLKKEDSIAFGDGLNDIEMFEVCGLSIAMGNANEKLKELADDVTTRNDQDGIYQAFIKYQLI